MDDARLVVPPVDEELWPTLGPEICDFIEDNLVHGPGDVLGEPVRLSMEQRAFIYRAYEVYPRRHTRAGRRRFKRAVLSRRKGWAKTELAAWLAIVEMDPEGPVRCDGWRREGSTWVPVGRPVRDPYIPMVAVTELQSEDLAYGAVFAILTHDDCALVNDYDVGEERTQHTREPGVIQPMASAPSARDGARTTFQHFDETHLFNTPRLKRTHATMQRNLPKRRLADAWGFETSTMYAPGEESVAEDSHKTALAIGRGLVRDAAMLFDHRQASRSHDIRTKKGLTAALREASGDAIAYADLPGIISQIRDPQASEADSRRYWLNQAERSEAKLFRAGEWEDLAAPVGSGKHWPADDTELVLGFCGSYDRRSTVLVGCTLEEPYLFTVNVFERPAEAPASWRPQVRDILDEIEAAMARWRVVELAAVPTGWRAEIEGLEDTYGETVLRFELNAVKGWAAALDEFVQAVRDRAFTHSGEGTLTRHLAEAEPVLRSGHTVLAAPVPAGAAAAAIAYSRAAWRRANPTPEIVPIVVVDPFGAKVADAVCRFCRLMGEVRELRNDFYCRACGNRWAKETVTT